MALVAAASATTCAVAAHRAFPVLVYVRIEFGLGLALVLHGRPGVLLAFKRLDANAGGELCQRSREQHKTQRTGTRHRGRVPNRPGYGKAGAPTCATNRSPGVPSIRLNVALVRVFSSASPTAWTRR